MTLVSQGNVLNIAIDRALKGGYNSINGFKRKVEMKQIFKFGIKRRGRNSFHRCPLAANFRSR